VAEIVAEGTFDPAEFEDELLAAAGNLAVGTRLWFQNDRVKVWEVRLEPGERGAFHAHTRPYFWTVVEPGTGRQRSPDGGFKVRRYQVGETQYSQHSPAEPLLHDLENVGDSTLRFVTVELLDWEKGAVMSFTVAKVQDVAQGVVENQFMVVGREQKQSLNDLDPVYRQLLDGPVTAVIAVMGPDGRPWLTPVWFNHDGEKVLLNLAEHRAKTPAVRRNPQVTIMLMNPQNPYHWLTIKATAEREIHEDDPDEGHRATETIDQAWTKYIGAEPPYGLRDPTFNERRVLFECRVDRVATFGTP
jgi:PPOX class probable F420-dependent enzyme